jgi:hypothetical protein
LVPILLGQGRRLFEHVDEASHKFELFQRKGSPRPPPAITRPCPGFQVGATRLCEVSATVTLKPWGSDDLPLLERLMGDPRMTEHLGGPESPDKLREGTS